MWHRPPERSGDALARRAPEKQRLPAAPTPQPYRRADRWLESGGGPLQPKAIHVADGESARWQVFLLPPRPPQIRSSIRRSAAAIVDETFRPVRPRVGRPGGPAEHKVDARNTLR